MKRLRRLRRAAGAVALVAMATGVLPALVATSTATAANPTATPLPKVADPMLDYTAGDYGTITLDVAAAVGAPADLPAPFRGLRKGYAANDAIDKGDHVAGYSWIINQDNTGDTRYDAARCLRPGTADLSDPRYVNAGAAYSSTTPPYPALCENPSLKSSVGTAPVVANGTEADLNATKGLNLPNGRYLISVTAPGYKIDGLHFTVNGSATKRANVFANPAIQVSNGRLTVTMNPLPLQTLTVRVNIFSDTASTNGQWDGANEAGLEGFQVQLNDVLGVVTTDVFGNPLCTEYYHQGHTTPPVRASGETNDAYTARYDAWNATPFEVDDDGAPVAIDNTGGFLQGGKSGCVSTDDGQVAIPNMGPNRYAVTVSPPDPQSHVTDSRTGATNKQDWIQTTTLEGGHDWDSWNQEGATGYDTERVVGNELTPPIDSGWVRVTPLGANADTANGGTVEGVVAVARVYVPGVNGQANQAEWNGTAGTKIARPIDDGVVALSCLTDCPAGVGTDETIYVGRTDADGSGHFKIADVPPATYGVAIWDESQSYILATSQIVVKPKQNSNMGTIGLTGWFTEITGHVFIDDNGNGKRDPSEVGVPNFGLTVRSRANSLYDQGQATALTNDAGEYEMSQMYPLGQFVVLEAYNSRYYTTGITYQADNQPTPTTMITGQVDIDVLPIIGLSGTVDWGVRPYKANENGGIVGTVSYDSTRNEHNPAEAVAEDYQPSVSGLTMKLYKAVANTGSNCGTFTRKLGVYGPAVGAPRVSADGKYCLNDDGSYKREPATDVNGDPVPDYVTETWTAPNGCVARDVHGVPFTNNKVEPTDPNAKCIEAPMSGVQIGGDGTVDGNYGFGDLPEGDYLVQVVIPTEQDRGVTALNSGRDAKPLYKVTDEESINVFSGDVYVPQASGVVQPCAADASCQPSDPTPALNPDGTAKARDYSKSAATSPIAFCAGALHDVDDAADPDFAAVGGSLYNHQSRPSCDTKLVTVTGGRSVAPTFHVYTDVPVPTRFTGLTINDLTISTDQRSIWFGEMAGIADQPVGVYDELGQLKTTVSSDYNGNYEILLPSTDTYNCPLPAGPCPNVYRLVANDPGQLGAPNANYNPVYRTIATNFQGWPGVIHPVDQAPTAATTIIFAPGSQQAQIPMCAVADDNPQLYSVSDPVVARNLLVNGGQRSLTIKGKGFGTGGTVTLTQQGVNNPRTYQMGVQSWTATTIGIRIPATSSNFPAGAYTLNVTNGTSKLSTVDGLTIHVLGAGYDPHVVTVGSGRAFDPQQDPVDGPRAIQRAIDAAGPNDLVVVYPNLSTKYAAFNPNGSYFENIVLHSSVKLQGVGPGGPGVPGSTIDGSDFWGAGVGDTDGAYASWWLTYADGFSPSFLSPPPSGETIYVSTQDATAAGARQNPAAISPTVDGFSIVGGIQQGFPNNVNQIGGLHNGQAVGAVETQGGGMFVAFNTQNMVVSNNVFNGNSGTYGGAIRVGTPGVNAAAGQQTNGDSSLNRQLRITKNRIINNGGTNLAGGIGLFNGTTNYTIDSNDICGNFSTEYGGAISHYGLSDGGTISNNRIWFNSSYDEGGAVFIGGELSSNPDVITAGAGAVTIDRNLIQDNLSNDDGGAVRFLMGAGKGSFTNAGRFQGGGTLRDYPMLVTNNIIANNVATHEGAGIAIDDTPSVTVANDTIVRNITTATAVTSDGLPAPTGLATGANSTLLIQAMSRGSRSMWSKPTIVNSVFADNRSGTWTTNGITGIGKGGATDIVTWDMGTTDGSGVLTPRNTVVNSNAQPTAPGNPALPRSGASSYAAATGVTKVSDIGVLNFKKLWETGVDAMQLRTNTNFRSAALVVVNQPITTMGDYHLGATSVALVGKGTNSSVPSQVSVDIDGATRPLPYDIGADEFNVAPTVSTIAAPNDPAASLLLDTFTRTALGANWSAATAYSLSTNVLTAKGAGAAYWVPTLGGGTANQQAGFKVVSVPVGSSASILLKAKSATNGSRNFLEVRYTAVTATSGTVSLWCYGATNNNGACPSAGRQIGTTQTIAVKANDYLGAYVSGSGTNDRTVTVGRSSDPTTTPALLWTSPALSSQQWGQVNSSSNNHLGISVTGATATNPVQLDDFFGGSL